MAERRIHNGLNDFGRGISFPDAFETVVGPDPNQNHILLMGEKGRIELEPGTSYRGNRLWVGSGRGTEITPPPGPGATQWAGQLDHLAQCVIQNREPIVPGEEGLRDIRIIEAVYRSAREHKRIALK